MLFIYILLSSPQIYLVHLTAAIGAIVWAVFLRLSTCQRCQVTYSLIWFNFTIRWSESYGCYVLPTAVISFLKVAAPRDQKKTC
jgi:hypothetical protein